MKERPIIFNSDMVRAILSGRKTQTRRPVRGFVSDVIQDTDMVDGRLVSLGFEGDDGEWHETWEACPIALPGDLLYVRETTIITPKNWGDSWFCNAKDDDGDGRIVQYLATFPNMDGALQYGLKCTPSIHMPKWAARIWLRITAVGVERVQDITEDGARAEGIIDGGCLSCGNNEPCGCSNPRPDARDAFCWLWGSIYGDKYPWYSNPWVWVIKFERVEAIK